MSVTSIQSQSMYKKHVAELDTIFGWIFTCNNIFLRFVTAEAHGNRSINSITPYIIQENCPQLKCMWSVTVELGSRSVNCAECFVFLAAHVAFFWMNVMWCSCVHTFCDCSGNNLSWVWIRFVAMSAPKRAGNGPQIEPLKCSKCENKWIQDAEVAETSRSSRQSSPVGRGMSLSLLARMASVI